MNNANRVQFSKNMMKGIRLKKFNELRIRLNDKNALNFPSKQQVVKEPTEAEKNA